MGSPEVALPALRALLDGPHEVVGVLTRPDARAGRGHGFRASPVADAAAGAGLPALRPSRVGDPDALAAIAGLHPDCAAVVAYGALLPQAALDAVPLGWVNLHFSLLPRWRGAAPVQHALFAGDARTGVTTFRIVRELDAGPVYSSLATIVGADETAGQLLARLAESGAGVLADTLDAVAVGADPTDQPTAGVSTAPKVGVADARIDWTADAASIDRRIRGCTPAPGAWTVFRGQRVKLGPAQPIDELDRPLDPGQLAVRSERDRVAVGTGDGVLTLSTVQPAGRPALPASAWARGARPGTDEGFTR